MLSRRRTMKRKRRIEIQIERRELSVYAAQSMPMHPGGGSGASPAEPSDQAPEEEPERCPVCGEAGMALFAEAVVTGAISMTALQAGLAKGQFHLHQGASRRIWVCRRSLGADEPAP